MARAFSIELPQSATMTALVEEAEEIYDLPTGPYANGALPVKHIKGSVLQGSWRIIGTSLTALQITAPTRKTLEDEGFEILLDCASRDCGGFDFRFATKVLPSPAMFVDIFRYRFLSALHPDGRAVTVFATMVSEDAYIQITELRPQGAKALEIIDNPHPEATQPPIHAPTADGVTPPSAVSLADAMLTNGYAVLGDLRFATGSDVLAKGEYRSLEDLAAFLKADPARRVLLVGHTDAGGSLDNNIALSKRRAATVVERMTTRYAIPATQIEAAGMGYLAPRSSNLTPEGRQANRRVEAILLNTK